MIEIVYRNKEEAETSRNLIHCLWCSVSLDRDAAVQKLVCRKCYDLMLNAGLKETEIFQQEEKKSKAA